MRNAHKLPTLLMLILTSTCGAASVHAEDSTPSKAVPAGRNVCWKEAGLSRGVMQQRRSIVFDARAQIRAVEDDSTLNFSQQKQEIRDIRVNARQQVAKLITPDQLQTLRQCRLDRAASARTRQADENNPSGVSSAPEDQPSSPQPK